jgi:hypothetical protein
MRIPRFCQHLPTYKYTSNPVSFASSYTLRLLPVDPLLRSIRILSYLLELRLRSPSYTSCAGAHQRHSLIVNTKASTDESSCYDIDCRITDMAAGLTYRHLKPDIVKFGCNSSLENNTHYTSSIQICRSNPFSTPSPFQRD